MWHLDPNPQVAGQGRDTLQRSQISVRVGVLAQQCEELNRPFFYWMRTGLPYVTLKLATSVDGRLGPRASAWMTSEAARHDVHRQRARVDAILTTATTVLADNPQLTVREGLSGCQPGLRQPLRVVLDRHNRLNHAHTYHVLNPHQAPTVCVVGQMADLPSRLDNVNDSTVAEDCPRVERITAPQRGAGFDLEAVLRQLAQHHGVSHLWVEAGGTLAGSLLSGQWVNRLRLYTAPYIIGDTAAPATVSGLLCGSLQQAIGLNILSHQWLETTQVLDAEPLYPDFVG
ncbi:MAG: bifunctional diaminohydroxyphosphoribosylaminopyrimidine deaminase/5-amino-6-(5-phosphoribosylamino)uracil reductase RibD [Vampirovibrionales bacterium]